MVYQIGVPPRRIDILTGISGVEFADAWDTRESADLDGHSIAFLSRDTLIKNKRAAGRLKDLADAERLDRRS